MKITMKLDEEVDRIIKQALDEDHASSDITSSSLISQKATCRATLFAKQDGVIAGLSFFKKIYQTFDPLIKISLHIEEGETFKNGDALATLEGSTLSILACERASINLLQHQTSIATTVSKYIEATRGYPCDILDTRKTLPGLRNIQKYAVKAGGGKNHRFDLNECIFIKENHLAAITPQKNKSIFEDAIQTARSKHPGKKLIIEVTSLNMLKEVLKLKPDHILLDNMNPDQIKSAVNMASSRGIYLEASGGINLSNVAEYAKTGVDGISVGRLTHSIDAIDMSLLIQHEKE